MEAIVGLLLSRLECLRAVRRHRSRSIVGKRFRGWDRKTWLNDKRAEEWQGVGPGLCARGVLAFSMWNNARQEREWILDRSRGPTLPTYEALRTLKDRLFISRDIEY